MKSLYDKHMLALTSMMGGQTESLESMVEKEIFGGARTEVLVYLNRKKRTVADEFQLIQEKKSELTRRQRDFLEYLHSKMQEDKLNRETEGGEQ